MQAYTIKRAAKRFGVDVDLLEKLAATMEPEDGLLWLHGHTGEGLYAFTEFGIENAAEQLRELH
jgi:hypothetical protein